MQTHTLKLTNSLVNTSKFKGLPMCSSVSYAIIKKCAGGYLHLRCNIGKTKTLQFNKLLYRVDEIEVKRAQKLLFNMQGLTVSLLSNRSWL